MKIQCKECRVEFNIPEDKIPEGKSFTISCPRCGSPLEIAAKSVSAGSEAFCLAAKEQPDSGLDFENEIDMVDEGVKTALLCDTNVKRGEKITQALQELDYWVVHAMRPAFALGKLHHNRYHLIVLDEVFHAEKESDNLVLHHIKLLPMHLRRQFFLCLLSREKTTMDAKLAFKIGVNLILNVNDLAKAKVLFARSLKEHRNFYALFNAELARKDYQS